MTAYDKTQHLAQFFARSRPRLDKLAGRLCDDANVAVDDAERRFMEMVPGNGTTVDWGMNVRSCAVCHQFAKYHAMELVPYMCAVDDVMSDRTRRGLQRTGSIALGATHCDFRYKRGGEPRRLAEQYPDRIRTARD